LGRFLKTSSMSLSDCLMLLTVGAIPLVVLELVKYVRIIRRRRATSAPDGRFAEEPAIRA
jgi:hypothetical protein